MALISEVIALDSDTSDGRILSSVAPKGWLYHRCSTAVCFFEH